MLVIRGVKTSKMSLPPFPSQDLAKLVLGYLAEEQLMTAYDEFLQASPYLDALRNEYDRIFMTSLKSILAEYRAVKIYVETCKPFVLRKKIFQCTNLLDIVKFLVTNVDINKIQLQEATDKASLEKQNTSSQKPIPCEVCQLASCVCKSKQAEHAETEIVDVISRESSIETTHLADLPGSHITKRQKKVKVLEKDASSCNSFSSDTSAKQSLLNASPDVTVSKCNSQLNTENSSLNVTVKSTDPSKSKQNIQEFNDVLESVVNRNKSTSESENSTNQRISNANSFQDFASGVSSGGQIATYSVPDSSTSENFIAKEPLTNDGNAKKPPKVPLLMQVSHINDNIEIKTYRGNISTSKADISKLPRLTKIQSKPIEKKIKIISDVKVSNDKKKSGSTQPKVLQNATSTPLMPMQTILINGTPVFKHTPKSHAFTEDEIMAMPTLIVVPSGPSQIPTSVHCQPIMTQNCKTISTKNSSPPKILGPLVIDVPSDVAKSIKQNLPDLSENIKKPLEPGLVKTVDNKNASVPKDSIITVDTNTPQILPPTRKSSSTPRRTTHVRVLDFTTPRRILHETINEQVQEENSDTPVEVDVSASPNIVSAPTSANLALNSDSPSTEVHAIKENDDNGSAKENDVNIVQPVKKDWDADLRALLGENEMRSNITKKKPRNSRKRKSTDKNAEKDVKEEVQNKSRNKKSTNTKKSKSKQKLEDESDAPDNAEDTPPEQKGPPPQPTINIISAHEPQEKKKVAETVKSKEDEECLETPESERLSLQNVIGAKLNISDIFETPYKQALYDIQMETPKFMDPDFLGEPLSDIKIMSIPTPRFLNTPKLVQATPSSNSSRPTDYSSGGSYYKPDDQDYMPIPEIMMCPVTSSKEDADKSVEETDEKKSRPIRQCTKNVSYYRNSSTTSKAKDSDGITDASSPCSATMSVNSSEDFKNKKDLTSKTPKRDKSHQNRSRNDLKKSNKKGRPPKDTSQEKRKTFMKIKPRSTPKKETPGRIKKRSVSSPYSKGFTNLDRKRTSSKEKASNITPMVTAMPTKSRRKSSTPRKLHCTKTFNSESSGHNSPEIDAHKSHLHQVKSIIDCEQESDSEHMALRWSDDGSQDAKTKILPSNTSANDIEDISKIQKFIDSSVKSNVCKEVIQEKHIDKRVNIESDGNLQRDLMKRGFDLETAKIIERDLLDETPVPTKVTDNTKTVPAPVQNSAPKKIESGAEKPIEAHASASELQMVQDDAEDDEVELSVSECNEESSNYFVFGHDDTKETNPGPPITLKDKFTMEVCIDDDLTVRLKATPFSVMLDQDPLTVEDIAYNYKETEIAVSSISNIERLYTPLKESIKAQCYEIFDSTLTSLDTPLKARSPVKSCETLTVTSLVEEQREAIIVTEVKKRKRLHSDESASDSKKVKQDADILFQTANIQNIDIESVLTKLHGP